MTLEELNALAAQIASQRRSRIGTETFLLAMLHPDGLERRALQECGISFHNLLTRLDNLSSDESEVPEWAIGLLDPQACVIHGRAEGFALAAGERLSPRHYLLSILWANPPTSIDELLQKVGATRSQIVGVLAGTEGMLPKGMIPPARQWSEFERISEEEFEREAQRVRSKDLVRLGTREDGYWISKAIE